MPLRARTHASCVICTHRHQVLFEDTDIMTEAFDHGAVQQARERTTNLWFNDIQYAECK